MYFVFRKCADIRTRSRAEYLNRLAAIYPSITWNPAVKPGYSGVAILARTQPLEVRLGLDNPEFDREGRVICYRYAGFHLLISTSRMAGTT